MACSRVERLDSSDTVSPESPIELDISTTTTKGTIVTEPSDMGTIGVYCAHTADIKWDNTTQFSKLIDQRFFISNQGECSIDGDPVAWDYNSLSDMYTIFAYSPHSKNNEWIKPSIVNGVLSIEYNVPNSSTEQPDLMLAQPLKNIYPQIAGKVPLNFSHLLATISFGVTTSIDTPITAITIRGATNKGTMIWSDELSEPQWILDESNDKLFSVDIDNYTLDSDNSAQVTSDEGYLMMIPQTLEGGAEVIVTLFGGEERSLLIPYGTEWCAGSKYHYVFSLDEEDSDFIYDNTQLSNCYMIHPTMGEKSIVQIPIQNRINDFWNNYVDGGSRKITDNSDLSELYVNMIWTDFEDDISYKAELLRDDNGKAAVWFEFSECHQKGNFVFSVSELSSSGDSFDILWSWHLWFTDYNPDAIAKANRFNIDTNTDGKYNLDGYSGEVHRYIDREGASTSEAVWSGIYKYKFIMDRNIGELSCYTEDSGAGSIFYQFGRKDPFPGVEVIYQSGKSAMSSRTPVDTYFTGAVEFASDFFVTSSSPYNWCTESITRDGDRIWYDQYIYQDGYTTGKSIFDPSPLGWRVPVIDTWNAWSDDCISTSGWVYNKYGYRDPSSKGALDDVGEAVYMWGANQHAETNYGACLYISSSKTEVGKMVYLSCGMPVRAIQE